MLCQFLELIEKIGHIGVDWQMQYNVCGCRSGKPSRDYNSSFKVTQGFKGLCHELSATVSPTKVDQISLEQDSQILVDFLRITIFWFVLLKDQQKLSVGELIRVKRCIYVLFYTQYFVIFYHHFVHIYALFCFVGDNLSKRIKKGKKVQNRDYIVYWKRNRDQEFSFDES